MQRLMNRLVGFSNDTVEQIDWKRIWGQLKWMNGFSKGYRGKIGFLTAISAVFAVLGVAYAYIYKEIVDVVVGDLQNIVTNAINTITSLTNSSVWDKFLVLLNMLPSWSIYLVLGYLVYKLISYAFSIFMQFFQLKLSMDLGLGIKRKVYATIMEGDWLSLTRYRAGDLVQRVDSDADTVSSFAMSTVPGLIVQAIQFIASFSLLIYLDWTLALVALVGVPMYLFVIKLKGRRTRDYNKRALELGAKNGSFLYESLGNIMVIKAFMLVPSFRKKYHDLHKEIYALTYEKTKYGIVTGAIIGIVGRVLRYGILIFLLARVLNGAISLGVLFAFGMLSSMVSQPVTSIMSFIMGAIEISASAERVMTLYELPRDRTQVPEAVHGFAERAKDAGMGLKIDNLAFSYIPGEVVLRDVDVEVKSGETVAFVGPSGEGKTTLIRLALGLLEPDSGRARLTGAKGETLDLSVETREFFSYVPQGNTMFSGTIRENMLMGNPDADDEQIAEALRTACIWDFVAALPDGLDAEIGERGTGLSEGQAQRMAIARALLRGAPILLLDEATSALDIYTEKAILDNIFEGSRCKTCLLTTHRPSVFTVCDKIYRVRQRSVELIKKTRDEQVEF